MATMSSLTRNMLLHLKAALVVSEPLNYLVRDTVTQASKLLRPLRWTGKYHVNGHSFSLEHGSDDTFIFQEIFVQKLYIAPVHILKALPMKSIRILDLGGNIGLFGLWAMIHFRAAELTAFEPDPRNAARYRAFLGSNNSTWNVREAFASNQDGTVKFSARGSASSRATEEGTNLEVAAVDVLPLMRDIDLVKMDIEGGEWNILLDDRFSSMGPSVLVLEYHKNLCPVGDEREAILRVLNNAGYLTHEIFHDVSGTGMLWAFRTNAPTVWIPQNTTVQIEDLFVRRKDDEL